MSYLKERNLFVAVLLVFVTCGLYALYLWIVAFGEVKAEANRHNIELGDPVIALLLGLVTCGIYSIYYMYKVAEANYELGLKYNYKTIDPIAVLILTIFVGIGLYVNVYSASKLGKVIRMNNASQNIPA